MKTPNYDFSRRTILDNFQVTSLRSSKIERQQGTWRRETSQKNWLQTSQMGIIPSKESQALKKHAVYYNNQFGQKGFLMNGVNYFKESLVMNESAQVLKDCYSVKGDYFYLKKGQIIRVISKAGDYIEVKYQKFVGYFPSLFFKLIK